MEGKLPFEVKSSVQHSGPISQGHTQLLNLPVDEAVKTQHFHGQSTLHESLQHSPDPNHNTYD